MSAAGPDLVGVVLAGGAARRLGGGGGKAAVRLGGATLLARAVATLSEVVPEVVVCARAETRLPDLEGSSVTVWREPADGGAPHPLAGLAWALGQTGGRAALCCPVDLPFLDAATLRALAVAVAVAGSGGLTVLAGQPLVGRFPVAVAPALEAAAREGRAARAVVLEALGAVQLPVADPGRTLFNVNTAEDLAAAEAMLRDG